MVRAFAAQTGLLDAAEWHMLGGDDAGVDAHHAVLQRLADAENTADVAGVEIAGQTEFGVVGRVNRFFFRVEAEDRGQRAKGFFAGAQHVGTGVGQHGGLEKLALEALAAGHQRAAFGQRIGHVAFHFLQRGLFNQRALRDTGLKAVAHLERAHFGGKLLDKGVVNAVLHINPVGADASLAGVAVFAGHGAVHRAVQVRIVKHDEGRIAAEFQREFLHGRGALLHQDAAHFSGAGKAQVPHHVAGAQDLADGDAVVRVGAEHVQDPGWNPCALGQLGGSQRGQRREFGRFDDHRAARSQCRGDLAGDHGDGEVPRRDGRAHAHRLLEHQEAAAVVELRQGLAVDALGFFGKPLDKAGGVGHFALGFGKGFALLGGHDAGQIVLVGHDQIEPFAQNVGALFARFGAPCRPGGVGCGNRLFGLRSAQVGDLRQFSAGGRVVHPEGVAANDPLAVDQALVFDQAGVLQVGEGGYVCVHARSFYGYGNQTGPLVSRRINWIGMMSRLGGFREP